MIQGAILRIVPGMANRSGIEIPAQKAWVARFRLETGQNGLKKP